MKYRTTKEAVRGLTKVAAKEWGQYGICVNCVLPGAESPAARAWAEKFPEEYKKQVMLNPMHRFGEAGSVVLQRSRQGTAGMCLCGFHTFCRGASYDFTQDADI